ncbi:MAG: carboxypeptidase regulatory-like domain-containing protein, partial [Planctomycetes bacterium]|nr:carboxypeptidase regulatory-like domain-containing protein [Planctomycetota bacterium]
RVRLLPLDEWIDALWAGTPLIFPGGKLERERARILQGDNLHLTTEGLSLAAMAVLAHLQEAGVLEAKDRVATIEELVARLGATGRKLTVMAYDESGKPMQSGVFRFALPATEEIMAMGLTMSELGALMRLRELRRPIDITPGKPLVLDELPEVITRLKVSVRVESDDGKASAWIPVEFDESRHRLVVCQVQEPGSLTVIVRDAAGAPVAGLEIHAVAADRLPPNESDLVVQTDEEGRAVLTGLAPGALNLSLVATDAKGERLVRRHLAKTNEETVITWEPSQAGEDG